MPISDKEHVKAAADARRFRERRRKAGLCVGCAKPAPNALCSPCASKKAAWKSEENREAKLARAQYRAAGLCTGCGDDPTPGFVTCPTCREKRSTETLRQREAARQRMRNTGVSPEHYRFLLKAQDSRCAICGIAAPDAPHGRLCGDHDHVTGAPRGLLCNNCNSGIGMLRDDEGLLVLAIEYLRKYRRLRAVGG